MLIDANCFFGYDGHNPFLRFLLVKLFSKDRSLIFWNTKPYHQKYNSISQVKNTIWSSVKSPQYLIEREIWCWIHNTRVRSPFWKRYSIIDIFSLAGNGWYILYGYGSILNLMEHASTYMRNLYWKSFMKLWKIIYEYFIRRSIYDIKYVLNHR